MESSMTPKPTALAVNPEGIPEELRAENRWCLWRYELRGGDWKKIPFRIDEAGDEAKVNVDAHWGTFDNAIRVYRAGGFDGIGCRLGDGLSGVDLDDCRNPETGALKSDAKTIIDAVASYGEVSPSQTGVKLLVRAWLRTNHVKAGCEVYSARRYFCLTGSRVEGTPTTVEDRQRQLDGLVEAEFGARDSQQAPSKPQRITNDIPHGNRNDQLFRLGSGMRRQNLGKDAIRAALREHNKRECRPPLEDHEVEAIAQSVMRYKATADTFPLTEAGDAEFFASIFGDRVRFDWRRHRWLVFLGHRWVPDAGGELHRLGLEAVRARQQAALTITNADERKAHLRWAVAGESRKRIDNMLALARSVRPVSDPGDGWDADPWLLGVENGVLDLRSGALRAGRPDDRITMCVRAAFDPVAPCDLWTTKVDEIFDRNRELVDYVQRAFGYSLTGVATEQCLFLNWGSGANGKGTLINTFAWVVGDYADDLPFSALELQQRASIPNDVAKLVGKRFVTSSESNDGVQFNEARIKALTGCDPITARFMRAEWFTFQPVAKFWLASNHKPKVNDDSFGFWRRIRLIPFTQQFAGDKDDKDLKDKLKAEAAGILRWAVEGALAWQRQGLESPEAVIAATRDYERESDALATFFEERVVVGPNCSIRASEFYQAYERWCFGRVKERDRLSMKKVGQLIRRRGIKVEEKSHVVTYHGIGLLTLIDRVAV
jgi:putative DNA primase/helicase